MVLWTLEKHTVHQVCVLCHAWSAQQLCSDNLARIKHTSTLASGTSHRCLHFVMRPRIRTRPVRTSCIVQVGASPSTTGRPHAGSPPSFFTKPRLPHQPLPRRQEPPSQVSTGPKIPGQVTGMCRLKPCSSKTEPFGRRPRGKAERYRGYLT